MELFSIRAILLAYESYGFGKINDFTVGGVARLIRFSIQLASSVKRGGKQLQWDITQFTELVKVLLDANPVNLLIICVTVVIGLAVFCKAKQNATKDEKKDQ